MLDTWIMAVMIMARERHNVVPMAIFCCRRIETFQRRRRGMVMTKVLGLAHIGRGKDFTWEGGGAEGRQTEDVGQNIQSDHRGGKAERERELTGLCALHCS